MFSAGLQTIIKNKFGGIMCTAAYDRGLIGRTLDLEYSYGEEIVVTPRKYPFRFTHEGEVGDHYALLGVAHVSDGTPLYYDCINEAGLGAAALNFPGCAVYRKPKTDGHNIASFELIPWILKRCDSVDSAEQLLGKTAVTDDSFSPSLHATPLHWMIADRRRAITVESTADGLIIHKNKVGVLTNAPAFPYHLTRLSDLMHLDSASPRNTLCPRVELNAYSRGLGAVGLPGDWSSSSRFVRAVFALSHTARDETQEGMISRFFRIMDCVTVPCGCIRTEDGRNVRTVYTSCGDLLRGEYYFTSYGCRRITGVRMNDFDLDSPTLSRVSVDGGEDILWKKS